LEWSHTGGRYNLRYILARGEDQIHASNDVDFQTIERFVFLNGGDERGDVLVIDRMHNEVHFMSERGPAISLAERLPLEHTAEFIQADFNQLIEALNESGLRNWQEIYQGETDPTMHGGGRYWMVAMLFSDGTIMQRSGNGASIVLTPEGITMADDFFPPQDQWTILTNFVQTLGQEIIERHNAENAD